MPPDITQMTMETSNNKILIMAGGTGGHVFPALSIAEYLLSRGVQVEWLGTRNGLEATVIPGTEIPLHYISVAGLRGSSVMRKLLSPFVVGLAIMQSMLKVLQIKPGCVLGMGGFVTGPGGLAAWLLRRKLLIHEQNAIAGLTNQLLFPLATSVMEAFPGAFERKQAMTGSRLLRSFVKPDSTIVVGNPIRSDIAEKGSQHMNNLDSHRNLRVLVIGGSLGAVAINKVVPAMLALFPETERPEVLHQCGNRNQQETEQFYSEHGVAIGGSIRVQSFIENMADTYAWADIIIARAGAMTVSEIAAVGLASILIPYPYAVDDHQTENAGYLVRAGAADIIRQEDLDATRLLELVSKYANDRKLLRTASSNARQAGHPDATEKAARLCLASMEGSHA